MTKLKVLSLRNNQINNECLRYFPNLEILTIGKNTNINGKGFRYCQNLLCIDISENTIIHDEDMIHLKKLERLFIPYNYPFLTDKCLKYLTNLRYLQCTENFTNNGIRQLKKLQYIDFHNNGKITGSVFKYLPELAVIDIHCIIENYRCLCGKFYHFTDKDFRDVPKLFSQPFEYSACCVKLSEKFNEMIDRRKSRLPEEYMDDIMSLNY